MRPKSHVQNFWTRLLLILSNSLDTFINCWVPCWQEETTAEKHPWLGHRGHLTQLLRKMNPREAEEPPVQSEPVDLSRRSDSDVEDTTNNNEKKGKKHRWHSPVGFMIYL